MTAYTPREGDRIKVEMSVGSSGDVLHPLGLGWSFGPRALVDLIAAGKVELVARAEPVWQPGDIGQHTETGELFRYWPIPADARTEWLALASTTKHTRWHTSAELAGKLRRMRLVPEDEAPSSGHEHLCGGGAEAQPGGTPQHHHWTHTEPVCNWGEEMPCPPCGPAPNAIWHQNDPCHVVPQVGDGGTNLGADDEPPLGIHRDDAGAAWHRTRRGWLAAGDETMHPWSEVSIYGPFKKLHTVDDLIPDGADDEAVAQLVAEADMLGSMTAPSHVRLALNALRARAGVDRA